MRHARNHISWVIPLIFSLSTLLSGCYTSVARTRNVPYTYKKEVQVPVTTVTQKVKYEPLNSSLFQNYSKPIKTSIECYNSNGYFDSNINNKLTNTLMAQSNANLKFKIVNQNPKVRVDVNLNFDQSLRMKISDSKSNSTIYDGQFKTSISSDPYTDAVQLMNDDIRPIYYTEDVITYKTELQDATGYNSETYYEQVFNPKSILYGIGYASAVGFFILIYNGGKW